MPTLTEARAHKRGGSVKFDFDTVWEITNPSNIAHNGQGLYSYTGDGGSSEEDIGTIRTLQPLNPNGGISSFEITLLDTGEKNYIGVGVCSESYPKNLLPGWEPVSVAFHADEGNLFQSSDDPTPLNQPCKKGDVIRCTLVTNEHVGKVTVEFHRNGTKIAEVETEVPPGRLYGVVGMMSKGERFQMSLPMIIRKIQFDQIWEVSTPTVVTHHGYGVCSYSGPGDFSEDSIGTVRGKAPLDPLGQLHSRSFEIRIIDPGDHKYIAIGICSTAYPKNMLPGWEETSVGYHADNGNLFHSCGDGQPTDHPCKEGDVMRCTVEPVDKSSKQLRVLFHKNGQLVGQVTTWAPDKGFYLCYGMMSKREKVQVVLPEISLPYTPPKKQFLDVWEICNPNLQYQGNGICSYVGKGGSDHVGTVRSKLPLSAYSPNNTFEVKIVNPGSQCYIALGLCSKNYPNDLLPGWEEMSLGFHCDNGLILQNPAGEQQTSHPCRKGDIVRCTIEPVDGSEKQVGIVFHRNGNFVGRTSDWTPREGYYAQVGCMGEGEVIQITTPQMELSFLQPEIRADRPQMQPSAQERRPVIKKTPSAQDLPEKEETKEHYMEGEPTSSGLTTGSGVEQQGAPFPYPPHPLLYASFMKHHPPPHGPIPHNPHHMFPYPPPPPFFHPYHHPHPAYMSPYSHHSPVFGRGGFCSTPTGHPDARTASPRMMSYHHYHHRGFPFMHPIASLTHPTTQPTTSEITTASQVSYNLQAAPTYAAQASIASNASSSDAPYESSGTESFGSIGSSLASQGYESLASSEANMSSGLDSYDSQASSYMHSEQHTSAQPEQSFESFASTLNEDTLQSHKNTATLPSLETQASSFSSFQPDLAPKKMEASKGYKTQLLEEQGEGKNYPDSPTTPSEDHIPPPHSQPESLIPPRSVSPLPVAAPKLESVQSPHEGPQIQRPPVRSIPKEENKMFQILHNVKSNDDGSLECEFPLHVPDTAFVLSRLPLTEKVPYFEVDVQKLGPSGNVAVGLVGSRFPPTHLPGMQQGSVAFHSSNGSVFNGPTECFPVAPSCVPGDVIGCKAHLQYKLEASRPENESVVQVEFFRNGCSVRTMTVPLPSLGFFPAIGLTSATTSVRVRHEITVTPENYFKTHPLPESYSNFPHPPSIADKWKCIQNSRIENKNRLLQETTGQPAVIQSALPFSEVTPYFEAELLCPITTYSVLSLGTLLQAESGSKQTIPGEAPNSVGFLPLLGFVMRNGAIISTVSEALSYSEKTTIGIGIDFCPQAFPSSAEDGSIRVKVFFTVNGQQVNFIITNLPEGGFYPTIAADCVSGTGSTPLVEVKFPQPLPTGENLPYGFIRGTADGFELHDCMSVVDTKGLQLKSDDRTVRVMQAALPLSPSHPYFEIRINVGAGSYRISCGLASHDYPLHIHPGWGKESIAFHADDGRLFHNSEREMVAPPCPYKGATLGCGVSFPEDGSTRYAEVFFTVNRQMVARRFVSVPQLGFFPTIGMRTEGAFITVDLNAPNPFPDLHFNTTWGLLDNIRADGSQIQLIPGSQSGTAQLAKAASPKETSYFKISTISEPNGKVFIGFSASKEGPFSPTYSSGNKYYALDITSGMAIIRDQFLKTNEACMIQNSHTFGCGIQPLPSSEESLLFFTADNQVIYCTRVTLQNSERNLYPSIFIMGSTSKIKVDACALWPLLSPAGRGWAKYAHLCQENSKLSHTGQKGKCGKLPVGFAQTSMPLTPSNPYFEVEVCSRVLDKAIGVGLAARQYPSNTWVGWKADSIAYHLDDGRLFKGNSMFAHSFGPKVFAGHTVGCGIRFGSTDHVQAVKGGEKLEVFFTLNGALIGTQKMAIPCGGFFPTLCLETPGESVIFHMRSSFPSVSNSVSSEEWGSAYSIQQAGRLIEHRCRHRELHGGIPKAFCQARLPFSTERPYFEVQIAGVGDWSQIAIGAVFRLDHGCTSPNTNSIVYKCNGQVVIRTGPQKSMTGVQKSTAGVQKSTAGAQKSTTGAQKCGLGDRLGCAMLFTHNQPSSVEFYLNNMKVINVNISEEWNSRDLHPTIILTHPGDAVIPMLRLPLPEWDRSMLIGWLRSERVKLRSSVIEYAAPGNVKNDVGVAQVSQPLQIGSNSYYEVEVLDPGAKCTIAVGAASADYPLNMQPGWGINSVGYHGDDGGMFREQGMGECFGPSWRIHDVVGLGIRSASGNCEPGSEVQVYFTRNGEELGHITATVPRSGFFPTIGLHSAREKVKINFCESSHTSSNSPKNAWRTLCGLKVSKSADGSHTLQYWDNGRYTPKSGHKLALGVAHKPFTHSMQYFEVKILSFGVQKAIAIGVVPKMYSLDHAPGWLEGSVAYHTDNGELYCSSGRGKVFGPVSRKGDVVGCGVSFIPNNDRNCSVFFTYNGVEIGRVRAAIPKGGFYPAICSTSSRDKVAVRFLETFKPSQPQSEHNFVGLMRINNCSYSGQMVQFTGSGDSGITQAPAMAQFAIALHKDRNYFSANLVRCRDDILIGLAVRDYPMKYAPGHTSVSVAYNVSKGSVRAVFSGEDFHNLEAPKCSRGDTVGCGIEVASDSRDSKTDDDGCVFFTKNGVVVMRVKLVEVFEDLYPVVGIIPKERASALFLNWNTSVFEPQNSL